jgi:competence protein ComEC
MLLLLAFCLGCVGAHALPVLPDPAVAGVGAGLALLGLRFRTIRCAAALALGVCWAALRAGFVLEHGLHPALVGEPVRLEGRIAGVPEHRDGRVRFLFDVTSVESARRRWPLPGRVRLDWYGRAPAPVAGERWRLNARLRSAHGFRNPGGFDYERWLFEQRIRATGYVRHGSANARLAAAPRWHLHRVRQALSARIDAALGPAPHVAVLTALAIGIDAGIGAAQWETLRRTGTTHLISISGLHVSLIAGLAFVLGRASWARTGHVAERLPAPRVAAVLACLAALAYTALAGASVPSQRACVGVLCAMAGLAGSRRPRPGFVWATALTGVLVFDPMAPLAIGFWLSFVAAGIIVAMLAGRAPPAPNWQRALRVQAGIALGLAPLLLAVFGQNPVIGPVANVLAVPWVTLVVVPVLLLGVGLLAVAPAIATAPLACAHAAFGALWWILERLSTLDIAVWEHAAIGPAVAIAAAIGVLLLLLPRGLPGRWIGWLWLLGVLWPRLDRPAPGAFTLTALDVGQGLAAVIETRRHVLVFDTGPPLGPRTDAGALVVVPYLRHRGIGVVDALVVSHADLDHRGGVASVRRAYPSARVYASWPYTLANAPCRRGLRWRWDGVDFEFLHPQVGQRGSANDRSCVLRIANRAGAALLPGDIEHGAEAALAASAGPALHAQVLIAPHHGSATSSSAALLAAVRPAHVIVPAGYQNRYGFPAAPVLERYRAAGAGVWITSATGAVRVAFDRAPPAPLAERERRPRYWQH